MIFAEISEKYSDFLLDKLPAGVVYYGLRPMAR